MKMLAHTEKKTVITNKTFLRPDEMVHRPEGHAAHVPALGENLTLKGAELGHRVEVLNGDRRLDNVGQGTVPGYVSIPAPSPGPEGTSTRVTHPQAFRKQVCECELSLPVRTCPCLCLSFRCVF